MSKVMTMDMVPVSLWKVIDTNRSERLLTCAPNPYDLIDCIIETATVADGPTCEPCYDEDNGFYRYRATFNLSEELVDQFFNGRSGYRAQYYLSPESGDTFNRLCVEGLVLTIRGSTSEEMLSNWSAIEKSLLGKDSKVWIKEDGNIEPDKILKIERWGSNEIYNYDPNKIILNGTLVCCSCDATYLNSRKERRALDLHEKGRT